MSFLTFVVIGSFAAVMLLTGWLEDYNHRVYQRDMDRKIDAAIAKWENDTTPTDWVYLAGLGPKGGRGRDY